MSTEALWDQIERKQLCKDGVYHTRRAKHIQAMAFNLLNLVDQQVFKDKKKVQIINNLKKDVVILSPDKGSGIVLLDINEYKESMHMLFADRSKFRIRDTDPTNSRLPTLQNYIRKIHKRGEVDDEVFKNIYPKNAKIACAYGTAKIHKEFEKKPSFHPIIDAIGSTHYAVGKYISKLINPLILNQHQLKDSFDAAERIKGIPGHLYKDGYVLISLDVVSLFTNVPLTKTINVILDRIYKEKRISTTLHKRTLKKLITDTCSKTAFSCGDKIYEQIDGVSMGASPGPALANHV